MVVKHSAEAESRRAGDARELPDELARAIEDGRLTQEQLRQLISFEASELGLTFEEAVDRARRGKLPKNSTGSDLDLLVTMLSI